MDLDKQIARIKRKLEVSKVIDSATGCWLFNGNVESNGYGRIYFLSKQVGVHRLSAYLYLNLSLKDLWYSKIYVLHKDICPNRNCFNPAHIRLGSQADNMADRAAKITHCPKGHEMTPANTYRYVGHIRVHTWCRECRRASARKA